MLKYYILIMFITLSGCDAGTIPGDIAPVRPTSTITGIPHDNIILNGRVRVYNLNNDGSINPEFIAETLSDAVTGIYKLSFTSPNTPVAICVIGRPDGEDPATYFEESSGVEIVLNVDQRLCAATNMSIGENIGTLAITRLTNDAYALAQYLIKTGRPVKLAVDDANRRFSDIFGFDIVNTWPLVFTETNNAIDITPTNEHLYGLVSAATSQQFISIGNTNGSELLHSTYTSFLLSEATYDDLLYDGVYNGQGASGLLSFGSVPLNAALVRSGLAANMFVSVSSDYNATGMLASDIAEFAMRINDSTDLVFSGSEVTLMNVNVPVVVNTSINGDTVYAGDVIISANISDQYGIASVVFMIDDSLLVNSIDGTLYSYTLPTAIYTDGPHVVSIVATNTVGGFTESIIAFEINNNLIKISNIQPADGSFLRGDFPFSADISNVAPITNVGLLVDGSLSGNIFTMGSYATVVDSLNIDDGLRLFTITASDGTYSASESVQYVIDNIPPSAVLTNIFEDSILSNDVIAIFDAGDNNGVDSVSLSIDGLEVGNITDPSINFITFSTADLVDGSYNLSLSATDKAGNQSITSIGAYVDRLPPGVSLNNLVPSYLPYATISVRTKFSLIVSDANPITNVSVYVDNLTTANNQNTGVISEIYNGSLIGASDLIISPVALYDGIPLVEGYHIVTASATDIAGRVSTVSAKININARPPTFSISNETEGVGNSTYYWWKYTVTIKDTGKVSGYGWKWAPGDTSGHKMTVLRAPGGNSESVTLNVEVISSGLNRHNRPPIIFRSNNGSGQSSTATF